MTPTEPPSSDPVGLVEELTEFADKIDRFGFVHALGGHARHLREAAATILDLTARLERVERETREACQIPARAVLGAAEAMRLRAGEQGDVDKEWWHAGEKNAAQFILRALGDRND